MGALSVCFRYAGWGFAKVDSLLSGRWNAARAFAEYLDIHPQLYQNRNVIELGAGGGLPGIVAALNGAKKVRQQDSILIVVVVNPIRWS